MINNENNSINVGYNIDNEKLYKLLSDYTDSIFSIYKIEDKKSEETNPHSFRLSPEREKEIDAEKTCIDGMVEEMKAEIQRVQKGINSGDIKYIGVPNICFSIDRNDDDRSKSFMHQRMSRGFDDTELWNLYITIARFILPRLKEFKKQSMGYPCSITPEEWSTILDKMIWSLEIIASDKDYSDYFPMPSRDNSTKEEIDKWNKDYTEYNDKIQEGLNLLAEHFCSLWW